MKWVMTPILLLTAWTVFAQPPAWTMDSEAMEVLDIVGDVLDGVDAYQTPEAIAPAREPLVIDVRECVRRALAENAQVFSSEADVAARVAQHGQAKSLRLPQIKGQAVYSYVDGMPVDIYSGGALSFLASSVDIEAHKWQITAGFSLEQVLYAGGRIQAGIRASRLLAKSEAWKREAVLAELEYQAKQAFYDALLAKALRMVAEESVATFERHLGDATQSREVGLISDFEVLRAKTELGARRAELESAKSAEKIASVNLLRILAQPQDTPVVLSGKMEWSPIAGPVDPIIDEAKAQRAELAALGTGIDAAREQVAIRKAAYKPSAAAQVGWDQVAGGTTIIPEGWTAGVGVEWEIYAGGRRKNEVAEANAQLKSLEYQRADVERLVELDVRQAFLRVQEAIAKIKSEKGTVTLGEEGLRMAQLRFQEGAGTQTETLDAELVLTGARTQLVRALRDYAVAAAALDKAAGRSWSGRPSPDSPQACD